MATFNLKEYRPPNTFAFIGRKQGEDARKQLKLDLLDKSDDVIELVVPKDTTSFNPSFFLGLLYASISRLGVDHFRNKYNFTYETDSPSLRDILKRNIEDGIRNATNSINNKSGLSVFQ